LVTPETILRWYRELIARNFAGGRATGASARRAVVHVQQLVVRMATANSTWGYTRLVGALSNLGHRVGRNTVKRILQRHGLEPAPARGKRMPWKTFLRTHLDGIAAADFFSVEVLTLTGFVRYLVLFVIDLIRVRILCRDRNPIGFAGLVEGSVRIDRERVACRA
jgi:putative transposase